MQYLYGLGILPSSAYQCIQEKPVGMQQTHVHMVHPVPHTHKCVDMNCRKAEAQVTDA